VTAAEKVSEILFFMSNLTLATYKMTQTEFDPVIIIEGVGGITL